LLRLYVFLAILFCVKLSNSYMNNLVALRKFLTTLRELLFFKLVVLPLTDWGGRGEEGRGVRNLR
jgi:hypothetical protein